MEAGEVLTAAGLSGAMLAARSRTAAALSGMALLAASACTRFGIFEAGRGSARDPAATIGPQRERRRLSEAADQAVTRNQLSRVAGPRLPRPQAARNARLLASRIPGNLRGFEEHEVKQRGGPA